MFSNNLILKPYEFNGQIIKVPFTNAAFFNATAAAKFFGKLPKDWLKTEDAKKYIEAVRRKILTEENQLVIVKQGGNDEQGTWLHPKLGIVFARWLNVDFALWYDEQIESILHGNQEVRCRTRDFGIASSHLPEAQRFEAWLFGEVLPSIRKTGSYVHPQATPTTTNAQEIVDTFHCLLRLAHTCGFEQNQALLSADAGTKKLIGTSARALNRTSAPPADPTEPLADRLSAAAEPLLHTLLEPVQLALQDSADLMDFRARMLTLYPDLDGKSFAKLMGQALAAAEAAGYWEAQHGS